VFCWQAKRSIEFFPLPRAFSMTEMPYLCWAFLYTSTGVNSYIVKLYIFVDNKHFSFAEKLLSF
ncbi:hypothetical protein D9545_15965, partial [Geobacillus stearothermophilus]